ncbi:sugar ABC transporter ATP-binding protein [Nesterenkonia sp. MY13]|uniref:Sugar ABC transporter ATP-binding protein n=1 Tax=Nesterenkonia sedimenti TaxID=1463632 RepID=A0A7X8TLE3_9MICC|nr:sugar ABC transporter ATP-binding protein [Nesterenkonia sedimenti]NLS10740.1 sugar ABC transporter ATP-binding protein [Nesterenkonia sedimenti]
MTSDSSANAAGSSVLEAGGPSAVIAQGITKTYGEVTALDNVDFTVRPGTVHCLVGENGSGKSTLTKIIAGVEAQDSGTVSVEGRVLSSIDPRTAIQHGVRVIYQDLALFPNMSVAENVVFQGNRSVLIPVSNRKARKKASEALAALDLNIDPGTRLGDLSTAERQLVAIARTVSSDGKIILMDEPTASLTSREIDQLLETVDRLRQQGLSFVFISHKLREVTSVADDVTVLRDGQLISTGRAGEYSQERIAELMTGGLVENNRRETPAQEESEPVVEVRGLGLASSFHDIDFSMHRGRVLGLAGLVGSGRIEIGLSVAGLVRAERGTVRIHGESVENRRADNRLQYVPDDRLTEGLFLDWSIADNIVTNHLDGVVTPRGTVSPSKIGELADDWRSKLRVKTPDVSHPVSSLSGGNQQRVLLARALAPEPDVVILNNPTVGVDIGSRADIHDVVRNAADEGTAFLVISDEPAELLSICDDLVFIHEGRIIDRRSADSLSEETLIDIISEGGRS